MSIYDDDGAAFFDSDEFAEAGEYIAVPATFRVEGIFSAAHMTALDAEGRGLASTAPVFTMLAADLPPDAEAQGDRLRVRGVTYHIADTQPDGAGLVRLLLEEV